MKLSIITINYNNLEGLKKTAESVLNQTWRDFEWIIVDGGSSDGSAEYIEQLASNLSDGSSDVNHNSWVTERFSMLGFSADDLRTGKINPHFSHLDLCPGNTSTQTHHSLRWCSEPDKGVYNAMNKGITLARGEYLNFMNSGDCFHKHTTLQQVFEGNEYDADVLYGESLYHYPNKIVHRIYPNPATLNYFIQNNHINHQSLFIRRELQLNNKYDEDNSISSDYLFLLHCQLENRSFFCLEGIIICDYDAIGISQTNPLLAWSEAHEGLEKELINRYFTDDVKHVYEVYKQRRFNKRVLHVICKLLSIL